MAEKIQTGVRETWDAVRYCVQQSRFDEAEQHLKSLLSMDAKHVEGLHYYGLILIKKKCFVEAESYLKQALAIFPDHPVYLSNLGVCYNSQGRPQEALACYRRAIALDPNQASAYVNMGNILRETELMKEAIECYEKYLSLRPGSWEAHNSLGYVYQRQKRFDKAADCFRTALSFRPDFSDAYNNLAGVCLQQGRFDEAVRYYRETIRLSPSNYADHGNLLLALNYSPTVSPDEIASEHRRFDQQHIQPLASLIKPYPQSRDPDRRLVIGYVSGDFRVHSVSYFVEPVIAAHQHRDFAIHCYSTYPLFPREDHVTQRMRQNCDVWKDVVLLSDEELAEEIRRDQVDILIDLSGHTAYNRSRMLGMKPAPIQIGWVGYPNAAGISTVGYRISDEYADPTGECDRLSLQKIVRIPETGWTYEARPGCPDQLLLSPCMLRGYVTFGSFNKFAKIHDDLIADWCAILSGVPQSKLFICAPGIEEEDFRKWVVSRFAKHGIGEERLRLQEWIKTTIYHNLYREVDICLDTYPFNGGTTNCDAIWMGVPFISLYGSIRPWRVGLSILANVGLEQLAVDAREKYIQKAIELAKDWTLLGQLRERIRRKELQKTLLFDGPRFTVEVEKVYRQLWQDWCKDNS